MHHTPNHTKRHKKKGKLPTSHRSAPYRCFDQDLAEFGACWSCRTYPPQSYIFFFIHNA